MALPQWLLDRPALTRQQLVEEAGSARRYLERSTCVVVESARVIVALADLAGLQEPVTLPQWLRDRPALTRQQLVEAVGSAWRFLEQSTPACAVETERVIVALANLAGLQELSTNTATEVKGESRPMRAYASGLAHAARLREAPLRDQDPVANGYAHGYFDALDDMLAPLVGHECGSCEAKLWKLVLELRAAAMAPITLPEGPVNSAKKTA